jgi:hypothetical protein
LFRPRFIFKVYFSSSSTFFHRDDHAKQQKLAFPLCSQGIVVTEPIFRRQSQSSQRNAARQRLIPVATLPPGPESQPWPTEFIF